MALIDYLLVGAAAAAGYVGKACVDTGKARRSLKDAGADPNQATLSSELKDDYHWLVNKGRFAIAPTTKSTQPPTQTPTNTPTLTPTQTNTPTNTPTNTVTTTTPAGVASAATP